MAVAKTVSGEDIASVFDGISAENLDEYRQVHDSLWITGYSEGSRT